MCVALQSPTAAKPENYHATMDMLATHYSPGLHQILQYTLCMHTLLSRTTPDITVHACLAWGQ